MVAGMVISKCYFFRFFQKKEPRCTDPNPEQPRTESGKWSQTICDKTCTLKLQKSKVWTSGFFSQERLDMTKAICFVCQFPLLVYL